MRRLRTFEVLEERRLLWANALEHEGIGYLIGKYANVATVDRYVMADDSWLPDATLTVPSGTITSISVGDDGIYVAYGNRVDRFDHAGGGRVELVTGATKPIERLFVDEIDESMLIMTHAGGSISTYDIKTGQLRYSEQTSPNQNTILAHDAAHNRLVGSSPSNTILATTYSSAGSLETATAYTNSTSSSSYSMKIWIAPDGDHLFSDLGRISDTTTTNDVGRFDSSVEDIAFIGSMPVVRYNDRATLYTADTYLPVGSVWIFPESYEMLTTDDALIMFRDNLGGFSTTIIPLANFNPPRPDINPYQLSFQPEAIVSASDGTLLLLSGTNRSVFRWDAATQEYLPTISLYGSPTQIVYSDALNTAFLAYATGLISKIDLNAEEPHEQLLKMLDDVQRIAIAGRFFLTQGSHAGNPVTAYDGDLNFVERRNFSKRLATPVWNDANHTLYFVDNHLYSFQLDTINPTTPLSNIGQFQAATSSGTAKYSGVVRISPDNSLLTTGSGHILNALTLVREERKLAHTVTDLAWLGSRLYTVRQTTYGTEIERWNAELDTEDAVLLRPGAPLSLYAVADDRLVAVTRDGNGIPQFTLLDADLNVIQPTGAFVVSESDGSTVVTENGQTDTIEVRLSHAPASDVTLKVTPYDKHVATSPSLITFTPLNWDVPQLVQISAPDDATTDWNPLSFVVIGIDELASDPAFSAFGTAIVSVTVEDNDTTVLEEIDFAGIRYTFAANHNRVTRFDTASESWLTPLVLNLPEPPTGAAVNEQGIFVAYDHTLYRYDFDGTGQAVVLEHSWRISKIWSDENLLLLIGDVTSSKRVTSYDTVHQQIINDISTTFQSTSIDRAARRLVGRADSNMLGSLGYDREGRLFDWRTINGSTTFLLLPGGRLVDAASNVRSSSTLEVLGRLEHLPTVSFSAMTLLKNGWIVGARLTSLELYDTTFTQRGQLKIGGSPRAIRVVGGDLYLDYSAGISTEVIPYTQLENKPARSAESLAYTPKDTLATQQGYVYVNAELFAQVRRWNIATQTYDESFELKSVATTITYSVANRRLYIGYASGEITQIDLSDANPVELPFAEAGATITGLAAVGAYMFAATTAAHMTFSPEGMRIDSVDSGGAMDEYLWSEATQTVYYRNLQTGITNSAAINLDGRIPEEPLGGLTNSVPIGTADLAGPLSVSPEGNKILFSAGTVLNLSLNQPQTPVLPRGLTDGTWIGNELFTLQSLNGNSELQRWDGASLLQLGITVLSGSAQSLTRLPDDDLLAVTIDDAGIPLFRVFRRDLTEVSGHTGLTIHESNGGTRVSESGTSDAIEVSLSSPPLADVTITVVSGNVNEGIVSPATLVFTPENWNVPQVVTFTGVDDGVNDKTQAVSLRFSAVDDVIPSRTVTATVVDNENVSLPIIEHAGIAYFFMTNESRVNRLEVASGSWLPTIFLQDGLQPATTAAVDDDGMYVGYGTAVQRFDLDGTPRGTLLTTATTIRYLFADEKVLILIRDQSKFESYDTATGALLYAATNYSIDSFRPTTLDRARNRIYGSGTYNRFSYVTFSSLGELGGPYSDDDLTAAKAWTSPNGAKVFEPGGKVQYGGNLQEEFQLPGGITEVAYRGSDVPIILRGNKLTAYTNTFIPLKTVTMNHVPNEIVVTDTEVVTLTLDTSMPSGYRVRTVPLWLLNAPRPGATIDPNEAAFTPDELATATDGTLLLFSKKYRSIFRWDPVKQKYSESIPLSDEPDSFEYSPATNSVYVAYANKELVRFDLSYPEPIVTHLGVLEERATGMGIADGYLIVGRGPSTYSLDGTLVDAFFNDYTSNDSWRAYRGEFVWSERFQRAVYVVGKDLKSTEINADGVTYPAEVPGGMGRTRVSYSAYNGGSSSNTELGFVRLSPDQQTAIVGLGYAVNWLTSGAIRFPDAPTSIRDATWIGNRLFTARTVNGHAVVEERAASDYSVLRSWQTDGTAIALRPAADGQLVLVSQGADLVPSFTVVDTNLQVIPPPPTKVVGRYVFYENSRFDLEMPGTAGNDLAIATDKVAYLPGSGPSGIQNVTSYVHGINGVMIDLAGPHGLITLDDFVFKVGTNPDPSTWTAATTPDRFSVRLGAGESGSDRVEISWPDGVIRNTWLQVQLKAGPDTNLSTMYSDLFSSIGFGDVFYFGNKVGEADVGMTPSFATSMSDYLYTRSHVGLNRPITDAADHNKDGIVSLADILLVRSNFGTPILARLDLPALALPAAEASLLSSPPPTPAGVILATPVSPEANRIATALAVLDIAKASEKHLREAHWPATQLIGEPEPQMPPRAGSTPRIYKDLIPGQIDFSDDSLELWTSGVDDFDDSPEPSSTGDVVDILR